MIIAMLRIPFMGVGFLVSYGFIFYLVMLNFSVPRAAVFMGVPTVFFGLYFLVSTVAESMASRSFSPAGAGAAQGEPREFSAPAASPPADDKKDENEREDCAGEQAKSEEHGAPEKEENDKDER